MKRLLPYIIALTLAGSALAGPLQFTAATVQTNNSAATTVQTPDGEDILTGMWIDTLIFDFTAGNTDTNTITLYTLAGQGTGAARTIITLSNITADGVYPVRDLVTGVTGSDITTLPARIPLFGDKLRLTAIGAGDDTNTVATFTLYVIVSPLP